MRYAINERGFPSEVVMSRLSRERSSALDSLEARAHAYRDLRFLRKRWKKFAVTCKFLDGNYSYLRARALVIPYPCEVRRDPRNHRAFEL